MSRVCALSGKSVQTGNNVSHAHNKTRRCYLPNLQQVSLYSDTLGELLRVRASAYALRTVDHRGGLDAYLLATSDDKLSIEARRFKRRIKKKRTESE